MTTSETLNNEKLWDVFQTFIDDPEGVTKEEAVELADFWPEPGRTKSEIFDRAKEHCRRRASAQGWFIPRPTVKKGRGHAYVLATHADTAFDGYMLQTRIGRGVQKATDKAAEFIETNEATLSPVVRTAFRKIREIDQKYKDHVEQSRNDQLDTIEALVSAEREEQEEASGDRSPDDVLQ